MGRYRAQKHPTTTRGRKPPNTFFLVLSYCLFQSGDRQPTDPVVLRPTVDNDTVPTCRIPGVEQFFRAHTVIQFRLRERGCERVRQQNKRLCCVLLMPERIDNLLATICLGCSTLPFQSSTLCVFVVLSSTHCMSRKPPELNKSKEDAQQ